MAKKIIRLMTMALLCGSFIAELSSLTPNTKKTERGDWPKLVEKEQLLIRKKSVWKSPDSRYRDLFRDKLREVFNRSQRSCEKKHYSDLASQLRQAGFLLGFLSNQIFIIKESHPGFHGGGLYLIRCEKAVNLVIQAPHSYFDLNTGKLATLLFFESQVRGLFLNTIHRYQSEPGEKKEDPVHPADVAHEPGSWFHAATVGAALGLSSLRFVQLHGFEQRKSRSQLILSSGLRNHPPRILSQGLNAHFAPLETFGMNGKILGATTNVQQQALNQMRPGRFVHLEMTRPLREKLIDSVELRKHLLEALSSEW